MLSLIIFGIVALIAIVFLLNFNVRVLSRPTHGDRQTDKQHELPLSDATAPQTEMAEKPAPMLDAEYRRALRQFHSSQYPQSTTTDKNRLNDASYRSTLRSLKNQAKKKS